MKRRNNTCWLLVSGLAMRLPVLWKSSNSMISTKPATGKFFPPLATTTPTSEVKKVDSKTFSLINGVWVDNEHSEKKEIIKIRRGSQAYKNLIAAMPELRKYFEIGEKVIVNVGKYSIEIAEDGKIELTEEELKKIVG